MGDETSSNWYRGRPVLSMIVVGVVGLVVGLGAGYKIEQSRTRSDVNRLKAQIHNTAATGTKPIASHSGLLDERVGKASVVKAGSVTVVTRKGRSFQVQTTGAKFERAVSGRKTDIAVGHRVLVSGSGSDVLVLPPTSLLGRLVTHVAGNSFSVKKAGASGVTTILLSKVKSIDTVSGAKSTDLETGGDLLASGRGSSKTAFSAVEVILLPSGSAFAG